MRVLAIIVLVFVAIVAGGSAATWLGGNRGSGLGDRGAAPAADRPAPHPQPPIPNPIPPPDPRLADALDLVDRLREHNQDLLAWAGKLSAQLDTLEQRSERAQWLAGTKVTVVKAGCPAVTPALRGTVQ